MYLSDLYFLKRYKLIWNTFYLRSHINDALNWRSINYQVVIRPSVHVQNCIEILPTIQRDGTAFVSLFLTVKRWVLYAKHLTVAERSNRKPKSGFDTHVTISINLS